MKGYVYIICLCVLTVLVFYEVEHISEKETSGGTYVPTARFLSHVKNENNAKSQNNKKNENNTQNEKNKKETRKIAYLTFDDGPSENTVKILETLKNKKAVSSFFIIGKGMTKEKEEIIKQAVKQGNAVGIHTYCHEQCDIYCDRAHFFEDYDKAEHVLENILGKKPTLHRFPWGSNNGYVKSYVDGLVDELKGRGVKSFDWNVSGEDSVAKNVPESVIFANVKKDLTRFDEPIILLHDSATMKHTAAVLPKIIDYIREQGYEFDTLENHPGYLFPASWR